MAEYSGRTGEEPGELLQGALRAGLPSLPPGMPTTDSPISGNSNSIREPRQSSLPDLQLFLPNSMSHSSGQRSLFCSLMTSRCLEECLAHGKLSVHICEGAEGAKADRKERGGRAQVFKADRLGWIVSGQDSTFCVVWTHIIHLYIRPHPHSPTALVFPWLKTVLDGDK